MQRNTFLRFAHDMAGGEFYTGFKWNCRWLARPFLFNVTHQNVGKWCVSDKDKQIGLFQRNINTIIENIRIIFQGVS